MREPGFEEALLSTFAALGALGLVRKGQCWSGAMTLSSSDSACTGKRMSPPAIPVGRLYPETQWPYEDTGDTLD